MDLIPQSISPFKLLIEMHGLKPYPHQILGVKWMYDRETNAAHYLNSDLRGRGGIIALQMGYGKTLMLISIILCNLKPTMKTLIIVPTVLIRQTEQYIITMLKYKPIVYYDAETRNKYNTPSDIQSYIVITTLGIINSDAKRKGLLSKIKWTRVIVDEAHHVRNSKTVSFKNVNRLQRTYTWLLTGTPICNSMTDLHSLIYLVNQRVDPTMFRKFSLRQLVKKMVWRTNAASVIPLPTVVSSNVVVEWKCKKEYKLAKSAFIDRHKLAIQTIGLSRKLCCLIENKLNAIMSLIIQNMGNGRGKLVFCQYTNEISILQTRLCNLHISVGVINGSTREIQRRKILEDKPDIIIMQIQVGCEGLNLQDKYSEVYFTTPQWNPTLEQQAIARCARIGQSEKEVNVFHFQMDGFHQTNDCKMSGIEEYIKHVQCRKNELYSIWGAP